MTPKNCKTGQKKVNGTCLPLEDEDVMRSMHWLAHPNKQRCQRITMAQDLAVCEDNLPKECVVWSVIASDWCNHYGSLEFEIYWAQRGCQVTFFHFASVFKGNNCLDPPGPMAKYPNINLVRYDLWGDRCYGCFYRYIRSHLAKVPRVDVLKIQGREGVEEDLDGIQYTMMADLFLYTPEVVDQIEQIVFSASMNGRTLLDTVGREAENGYNMWATQQLLRSYSCVFVMPGQGSQKWLPLQFEHLLEQADIDPSFGHYAQTHVRLRDPALLQAYQVILDAYKPRPARKLHGNPPPFCAIPSEEARQEMQRWIDQEINVRCHPTRLSVPCDRTRTYKAFIPCEQELMDKMAEDYAISKRWCDFRHPSAGIEPMVRVDPQAKIAFQQPPLPRNKKVRLAFFFTVYADAPFVRRLVTRLYSPDHYYMLHVDPAGAAHEFVEDMHAFAKSFPNVFVAMDVPIVYGASTATMVLTRAMVWFYRYAKNWDYFVPLTGSDYPVVPLHRIEKIFTYQNPPMPFIMAWTAGTSTHMFRLSKTHPIFETHPKLVKSFDVVTAERGKVLGAVPMEYRSNNFGPPLFCNNRSTFYHLDIRFNKSARIYDTQWLFPRDIFPRRGRAYIDESPVYSTPSFDGVFRVWKKSDPATTGAYDFASVEYIVTSEEGRKYWHFFKHLLLGSEEHYYATLLYNWERTRSFVQTMSAQIAWNTWELGLWEMAGGFQTHTHFLTMDEWDAIEGFAMRGMMFPRKFSTKKTAALLDRIDSAFLLNSTTEAGLYWPGFYEVDMYSSGRYWVAAHKRNTTQRLATVRSGEYLIPKGLLVGNVSGQGPRTVETFDTPLLLSEPIPAAARLPRGGKRHHRDRASN